MDVVGDIVARDRRSDRPALRVATRNRQYSYRDACTTSWKAGNVLRYLGVHEGDRVDVAPVPSPQPLFTFFGSALLGAVTAVDGLGDGSVVVVPADREAAFDPPPGSDLVVFGDAPSDPSATHWEGTVWSENPAFPPVPVSPSTPALRAADGVYTHRDLLDAAERVVDDADFDESRSVAVRAPLSDPRTLVAAVLAPLSAGGDVVLPDGAASADVAVTDGDAAPEPEAFSLDRVRM
ncbi:acetyl-CoA synthetase [Haloplanus sp. GCM10025708]|uniref:acetyl-CoA synthetase n=1 Tax=Haloferacaceae TaxID=1644056 RepID=UPI00360B8E08